MTKEWRVSAALPSGRSPTWTLPVPKSLQLFWWRSSRSESWNIPAGISGSHSDPCGARRYLEHASPWAGQSLFFLRVKCLHLIRGELFCSPQMSSVDSEGSVSDPCTFYTFVPSYILLDYEKVALCPSGVPSLEPASWPLRNHSKKEGESPHLICYIESSSKYLFPDLPTQKVTKG